MSDNSLIIAIVMAAILTILVIVSIVLIILSKRKPKIKVDEAFISSLVSALGGIENIESVHFINGRINFQLNDVESADLETLKSLSTTGVFVTNQTVKMLFSYDSQTICNAINSLK